MPTDDGRAPRKLPPLHHPEDAIRALGHATRYAAWRRKRRAICSRAQRGQGRGSRGDRRRRVGCRAGRSDAAARGGRASCSRPMASTCGPACGSRVRTRRSLPPREVGFPVVVKSLAHGARQATLQACGSTCPMGMRSVRPTTRWKTGLRPTTARAYVVQRMAHLGVSCVVAGTEDHLFGPVVSFAIAGLAHDLLHDVAYRIPPLTDVDVDRISEIRAGAAAHWPQEGAPPVDRLALADGSGGSRCSPTTCPSWPSIVLNPVIAHPAWIGPGAGSCSRRRPSARTSAGGP